MRRRRYSPNQKRINKKIAQGFGQGIKVQYKPFINVRDLSSKGQAARIKGWKTGRTHHLLSALEQAFFYILEWSPYVVDIREEMNIPLEESEKICELLKILHPWYYALENGKRVKQKKVITIDFRFTIVISGITKEKARSLKYMDQFTKREAQKSLIEKIYCDGLGVEWALTTDLDIPWILANNVKIIHKFLRIEEILTLSPDRINRYTSHLFSAIRSNSYPLSEICDYYDVKFGIEEGSCLAIAKHMIASRKWIIDMYKPFNPSLPLILLDSPLSLSPVEGV